MCLYIYIYIYIYILYIINNEIDLYELNNYCNLFPGISRKCKRIPIQDSAFASNHWSGEISLTKALGTGKVSKPPFATDRTYTQTSYRI